MQSYQQALATENVIEEFSTLPADVKKEPIAFINLEGWMRDDHALAFEVFRKSCVKMRENVAALRVGKPFSAALLRVCEKALKISNAALSNEQARIFFETHFTPYRITPPSGQGFLTGYFEPEVEGSFTQSAQFSWPLRARPRDLLNITPHIKDEALAHGIPPEYASVRRNADGKLEVYPVRETIENGAIDALTQPILYVRDEAEAFSIQVQGSARIRIVDEKSPRTVRVAYAGRNGHPYTSVGKLTVERGFLKREEATMDRLMAWLRADPILGSAMIRENRSYVFFRLADELDPSQGPLGAASVQLTPERSLAVDRNIWSYGLPVWLEADLTDLNLPQASLMQRLMIAQDTGSAIVGAARADYFVGSGESARLLASRIRHPMHMSVLVPNE